MTDPTATMQTAYYSKLTTPAIIYAGHTVRVYSDFAPSNAKSPYIILGAQTLIDNSNKTTFGSDFTQAVTVVDVTDASVTGRARLLAVANTVVERIRTRKFTLPIASDFDSTTVTLDNAITLTERTANRTVLRRELRFRHIINQHPQ
jgi:hypothetical protein